MNKALFLSFLLSIKLNYNSYFEVDYPFSDNDLPNNNLNVTENNLNTKYPVTENIEKQSNNSMKNNISEEEEEKEKEKEERINQVSGIEMITQMFTRDTEKKEKNENNRKRNMQDCNTIVSLIKYYLKGKEYNEQYEITTHTGTESAKLIVINKNNNKIIISFKLHCPKVKNDFINTCMNNLDLPYNKEFLSGEIMYDIKYILGEIKHESQNILLQKRLFGWKYLTMKDDAKIPLLEQFAIGMKKKYNEQEGNKFPNKNNHHTIIIKE